MKRTLVAFFVLAFFNSSYAQKIITSDIANFWMAYDSIQKTDGNKKVILQNLLLNKKSDGLKAFMEIKRFGEDDYLSAIEKYPKFWNSIRTNTLIDSKKIGNISKALKQLKKLYLHHSRGNIYYMIGTFKSGGTTNNEDLLLGIEKIVGDSNTIVSEFENANLKKMFLFSHSSQLAQITVHEFVHTLQKDGEVNVLSKAIKEGSCDFIAELSLNKKFSSSYLEYGFKNYDRIKSDFKKQMLSQNFGNWFYNSETSEHADLGYFVGYAITKKYYENAKDKKAAIKSIIELAYNSETAVLDFLANSRYFEEQIDVDNIRLAYKNSQPQVLKITEFENGNQYVDPGTKKIQILFSKPMNDKVSVDFSKFGKEHFPLKNILGFDQTKTILTLETTQLKPATEYDFYITDRATKSVDGYPFMEPSYKISFKTLGKN